MEFNIQEIQKVLPHRYPFLLIDKVLEINYFKQTAIIQKNVSINEPFFQGHFPKNPIMPGVLLIEAMAQSIAFLVLKIREQEGTNLKDKRFILAGVDNFRIKRPIIPGDVLIIETVMGKIRNKFSKTHASVYLKEKKVCSASFLSSYIDLVE